MKNLKHLKLRCVSCEIKRETNQEHVFPEWLIRKTRTNHTSIRWLGEKKINPLRATIPLCTICNHDFGRVLENPMRSILLRLEAGEGISDYEADIIVRWLWKITGLIWHAHTPGWKYSRRLTLREKVLRPLDEYRDGVSLAISRIEALSTDCKDEPMGIDTLPKWSGILASGVFGKIAMIATQSDFVDLIPAHYSTYDLSSVNRLSRERLFFPKVGFEDDAEAIHMTIAVSKVLESAHNWYFRQDPYSNKRIKHYGSSY